MRHAPAAAYGATHTTRAGATRTPTEHQRAAAGIPAQPPEAYAYAYAPSTRVTV
jgi:hypothetical protein